VLVIVLMRLGWYLAMVAVTVLALLPTEHLQMPVFDWWDKAQHALAFVVLTGWALLLWPHAAIRVALSMLAYGACLELAQWAVGWRFAEWADLAADAVGVFMAWSLVRWLRSQHSMGIESNSR
jgi:VanZ family protein